MATVKALTETERQKIRWGLVLALGVTFTVVFYILVVIPCHQQCTHHIQNK
ncbi:MAG: hypothetical protein ACK40X_04215 [Armatimonadota bacterium]